LITHLIFDFFGTLVGYTPGQFHDTPFKQTYQLLAEHGSTISYEQFVQSFTDTFRTLEQRSRETLNEFHMDEVVERYFQSALGVSLNQTHLHRFTELYIQEWNKGTTYFPGIAELVNTLASKYALCILSNTHYPDLIHRNLMAMNIHTHFKEIITSVEFGKRKPHPSIFHETLNRLRIDATQAIYIGDTYEDDYIGANSAMLRCILVDSNQRHLHMMQDRVDSLFDIQRLLT
jgi:putative hydrolase of the HAD superfamily